jgi:hypothetical protein
VSSLAVAEQLQKTGPVSGDFETPSTLWDFFKKCSGRLRKPAISSKSVRDVCASLRFLQKMFGTVAQACDFFKKCSGQLRKPAISSKSVRDICASLRFQPRTALRLYGVIKRQPLSGLFTALHRRKTPQALPFDNPV